MKSIYQRYKSMSIQTRAALWFTICSIVQKGISFITVPFFTRILSTEQYGTYSLYMSWLSILSVLTSLNLYSGVFNNAMVKYENDRGKYISTMQGLITIVWGFVFSLYLIFNKQLSPILNLTPEIMCIMFLEMLFTPALNFWSGKQRFEYKYIKLVCVTLGISLANPIIGLVAVSLSNYKGEARIISCASVQIIVGLFLTIKQYKNGKLFFSLGYWKYALPLAIPLLPHYLSGMILNQGDRVMIGKIVGLSEVALYSVAYNIGMLVQIITSAIVNSFTPWVYQKINEKEYRNISKTINKLLLFIIIMILLLLLCSPELVLIFGSKEYGNAVYVIPPVAASVFFIFLYNMLAIPQFYFEKTKFLFLSSVIAMAFNVGLNSIFIPIFGYVAAGYTTLLCYIMYSLGHYIVSIRITKKETGGQALFNGKIIFILSLVMMIMVIICNALFKYIYFRYGLIIAFFIVIIIKRKEIKSFLDKKHFG